MSFKDNKELRTFYDGLHGKSDLRFPVEDYPYFHRLLGLKPDSLLLDVACGKGFFLASVAGECRCVGIDFSQEALAGAKKSGGGELLKGEAEKLPFKDGKFDFVTNLGSLEHFLDKRKAVIEMSRVAGRDGKIMIILPNGNDLKTKWKVFRTGMGNDQDGQEETTFMSHGEWRDFLEGGGLNVERVVRYNGFAVIDWYYKRKDPAVITLTEKVVRALLTIFLRPVIPLGLSAYFIFICKPSGKR